jgi:hypothetical protein
MQYLLAAYKTIQATDTNLGPCDDEDPKWRLWELTGLRGDLEEVLLGPKFGDSRNSSPSAREK